MGSPSLSPSPVGRGVGVRVRQDRFDSNSRKGRTLIRRCAPPWSSSPWMAALPEGEGKSSQLFVRLQRQELGELRRVGEFGDQRGGFVRARGSGQLTAAQFMRERRECAIERGEGDRRAVVEAQRL